MQYEQDYILRLIKQVIRALIGILLNKRTTLEYEMPVNNLRTSGDDLLSKLNSLADAGYICEAENRLLEALECGSEEAFLTALYFYEHINEYDTDFLEDHHFSREEIREGVLLVAKKMGSLPLAAALLDEMGDTEKS